MLRLCFQPVHRLILPSRLFGRPTLEMNVNMLELTTVIPKLRDLKPPRPDPWGEDSNHPISPPVDERIYVHSVGVWAWLGPALVMVGIGALGITRPSLATDELLAWRTSTVSWRDMVGFLTGDEVTRGPYYALLHGWSGLFGTSDLALRLPSLVAMTLAAGMVGALGARLANRQVGLAGGLIFALLPGSSRIAHEASSYAPATFAAVLATCLLVAALRRPGLLRWAGYGLSVAFVGMVHPIALVLLVAHGWVVFAQYRHRTLGWLLAAVVGVAPALPLLRYITAQPTDGSWITSPAPHSLWRLPQELVGAGSVAVLLIALSLFSLPLRRPTAIYTAWAVLPLLSLVVAAQLTPLFAAPDLMFTLPAWALLAGVALGRGRAAWAVLGVIAVAVLAAPAHLSIRAPDGHGQGSRDIAATIAAGFRPGDGVVYSATDPRGNRIGRHLIARYTPADRRPADVLAVRGQPANGARAPEECVRVATCLAGTNRLWIVRVGSHTDPLVGLDGDKESVLRQSYGVVRIWQHPAFTLALTAKKSARQ